MRPTPSPCGSPFAMAPLALAVVLALSTAPAAQAQTQSAQARPIDISIAAQPLPQALTELARQAGVTLVAPPALLNGKTAPAVSGHLSARQALDRLLSGTGLVGNVEGGAITMRAAAPVHSGASLPPVTVTGQASPETATGSVTGHVARRSITAAKDDTPLMATPQSVSVVTRDLMDDQGAQTITEALRYVAGVNTSAYGEDPRYDWVSVRGFNQSVFGLYRDGLRASGSKIGMRMDPYGLERIEVLKGPSSVLYGQNAPGGLVNAVTKRPQEDMAQEVSLGVGSHDRKQVQFDVGGALGSQGTLSYRLTGNLRDSNTQMDFAPDDHAYIAPAITWKPDAGTSLTVLANYQKDKAAWGLWYPRSGTLFASPNGQIDPSFYPGEPSYNHFDRTQTSIGTLFEKQLGDGVVFRQGLRAETMRYDAKFVRGRFLINDAMNALDETGHILYRDSNHNRLKSEVYTADNQLAWTTSTGAVEHHLLAGLDVSRTHYEDRQYSGSAPPLDILNPVYGQAISEPITPWARDVTARQAGLYLQDRMDLGKDWIVRGGVRQDWAQTGTIDPLGTLALRQNDQATTFQAGLLYRGVEGIAPFMNYAQSFQPTADSSRTGEAFKPTKGQSLEAGVRYQPANGRGLLSASIFEIEQNNVLAQDPADPDYSIQTGQVRSRGLELEGNWEITRQLSVIASYTYLDAKVTRSTTPGQLGTRPQDAWSTTSPSNMASVWANYRFTQDVLRGASIGGGVRYMGSTLDYGPSPTDPDNNYAAAVRTPSYTVLDMVLGYELDTHWRFQFKVNNLLDKLYVANPCGGSQRGTCYYGPTRSVLASATYRW